MARDPTAVATEMLRGLALESANTASNGLSRIIRFPLGVCLFAIMFFARLRTASALSHPRAATAAGAPHAAAAGAKRNRVPPPSSNKSPPRTSARLGNKPKRTADTNRETMRRPLLIVTLPQDCLIRIFKYARSSISIIACVNLELSLLCKAQFQCLTLWSPNWHQLIKLDMAISAAPLSPIKENLLHLFEKGDWRDLDMIHSCATACMQGSRRYILAYVNKYIWAQAENRSWDQTAIDQLVAEYCLSL